MMLRPGNAGANRAADLISSLEMALAQLPEQAFDDAKHHLVVRLDSAGASHAVVEHLAGRGLGSSFAISRLPTCSTNCRA